MWKLSLEMIVVIALVSLAFPVSAQTTAPTTLPVDEALVEAFKEQSEAERQSLTRLPDAGAVQSLSEMVTFVIVDGKLKPNWIGAGKGPEGSASFRFQLRGSKALWALRRPVGGPNARRVQDQFITLSRVDPDRPDSDGPWSIHLMDIARANEPHVLAINAEWGPSADRDIVYFETDLATGATTLTVRTRNRALVNARAANLTEFVQTHREAVQKYLVPLFREVNGPNLGVP